MDEKWDTSGSEEVDEGWGTHQDLRGRAGGWWVGHTSGSEGKSRWMRGGAHIRI